MLNHVNTPTNLQNPWTDVQLGLERAAEECIKLFSGMSDRLHKKVDEALPEKDSTE